MSKMDITIMGCILAALIGCYAVSVIAIANIKKVLSKTTKLLAKKKWVKHYLNDGRAAGMINLDKTEVVTVKVLDSSEAVKRYAVAAWTVDDYYHIKICETESEAFKCLETILEEEADA